MITIHLRKNQLGSFYIQKDLLPGLHFKCTEVDHIQTSPLSIGIGESFEEDQKQLKASKDLHYQCWGLSDETPLAKRSFEGPTLLHIDLRIVEPTKASAIADHTMIPSRYLRWEEVMQAILNLNHQNIQAFHLSGYTPDRDRNIRLNHKQVPLNFHLHSFQETHQFTLALLYNCIEVLTKTIKDS